MTDALELGVNIDHIANIRQQRGTVYPDILEAVRQIEGAGAHAITLHLREDRRHIQDADVYAVRKLLNTRMNLEHAVTREMVKIALDVQPDDVCLVPERREELTTEGGLDIIRQFQKVKGTVEVLGQAGIQVSLFIEPDIEIIRRVPDIGAPVIELHTGRYAGLQGDERQRELERIRRAAEFAREQGIKVNAGHGLDYENTRDIAALAPLSELNIGHAMVARAVFVGIWQATREMLDLMQQARKA
ncbi:MAG TPA: pyridoxine 5'-phosphate synthase [Thiolinea sp.]|nr:pyridoxine 5'-phosphate synthase [Thiolinea sp.]